MAGRGRQKIMNPMYSCSCVLNEGTNIFPADSNPPGWRHFYLKVKIDGLPIPKGRLVKGPYKPICRDCAIYFSGTVICLEHNFLLTSILVFFFQMAPHVSVDVFPRYRLRYRTIWLKDGDASVVPRRLNFFFTASYVHPFGLVMIVFCDCFPDLSKTIPIILFVVAWIWVDHFLESGQLASQLLQYGVFPYKVK